MTAEGTPISRISLEIHLSLRDFFQTIWLTASLGF